MSTILITGGAGFIGSCLARKVVAEGRFRVVNLDKLTYAGNLDSLVGVLDDPRHVFVRGDIGDRLLVAAVLEEHRPLAVINLAAESHVDRSIDAPAAFIQTNVVGTCELLEATRHYWHALKSPERRAFRFLHVSTDEVYGSLGAEGAFDERSPYAPNSPYAASKAASDHLVRAYGRTYGLPVITAHASNNYGPFQFPEKLIPLVILNALEGRPLPIYGDGLQVRDWLHVEDHCDGLLAALEHGQPGEVYDLSGENQKTNLDLVRELCASVDALRPDLPHKPCSSLIKMVEDRPGHDRRYALDSSKARGALAWRPRHEPAAGLRATVAWYLENATWVERVTTGVYRRERLGLGTA